MQEHRVAFAAVERVVERREVRVRKAHQTRPRTDGPGAGAGRPGGGSGVGGDELVQFDRTRAEVELAEDPRELHRAHAHTVLVNSTRNWRIACCESSSLLKLVLVRVRLEAE